MLLHGEVDGGGGGGGGDMPSAKIRLQTSYSIFAAGVVIAGLFDNAALFCGSKDLIYALMEGNETKFCTLSGT